MMSGFEWVALVLVSTVLVALALLTALWFETQRLEDAWALSRLGEPLGLRYRVLGRDYLAHPEPFVVHEKPGAAAENSVIERSLVSTRAQGLPAVFEYVTYRDPMRLRRFGPPFLVLAVRVPAGIPSFRLRPKGLFEAFLNIAHRDVPQRYRVPPGWVMHIDGPEDAGSEQPLPDLRRLAKSGLWIQVSGNALFAARPLKPWQVSCFTQEGIHALIRQGLPVLQALDSPDAPQLETLVPPRTLHAQATGG
ncbi:hypothetical protein [Thioalkalivibrio nitratireducens]|nr:hypothetical protein [Thioalkalivibrio nitratireducens]